MAVDPNIKNKATKIRNEIYGKDVREALASGLEAMSEDVVDNKNRQDSVESRFQDVLDGTTDKDVISAPEILDARQGHSNLGQNLLSMKQELAQTEQDLTAQLHNKVGDGKLATMADLGQDVKEALTGGSVAVVGDNAVIESNIVDKQVTPRKTTFMNATPVTLTVIENQYIYKTGVITPLNGFNYSDSILLSQGETIVFEAAGTTTNVAMISEWTETGTLVKVLENSIDGEVRVYSHTATKEKEHIRLSWRNSYGYSVYKYTNLLFNMSNLGDITSSLKEAIQTKISLTAGHYIAPNLSIVPHTFQAFSYSSVIPLFKGDTINIKNTKNNANISIFNRCDENGELTESLFVGVTNDMMDYSYTETEPFSYIRASFHNSSADTTVEIERNLTQALDTVTRFFSTETKEIRGLVENVPPPQAENVNHEYKHLVLNAICVGDSLTDGGYYVGDYDGQAIEEDYPYYLSKITGWNVTEAGTNGRTASSWWNMDSENYDFSNYDTAIIWLGTNMGLTDTLEADTAAENYLNYADTHTGNYCKIIEKARTENPNIHIHLIKVNNAGGTGEDMTNNVIEQIGLKYGLHVFDLHHLKFGVSGMDDIIHPENGVHFGKVGNIHVAKGVYDNIIRYINENVGEYEYPLI